MIVFYVMFVFWVGLVYSLCFFGIFLLGGVLSIKWIGDLPLRCGREVEC